MTLLPSATLENSDSGLVINSSTGNTTLNGSLTITGGSSTSTGTGLFPLGGTTTITPRVSTIPDPGFMSSPAPAVFLTPNLVIWGPKPEYPVEGMMCFDAETEQLLFYFGGSWKAVTLSEPKKREPQSLDEAIDDVRSEIFK